MRYSQSLKNIIWIDNIFDIFVNKFDGFDSSTFLYIIYIPY